MALWKFFIIFERGDLHFHFALGSTNDVAGPASMLTPVEVTLKQGVSVGGCASKSRAQSSWVSGFRLAGMRDGR